MRILHITLAITLAIAGATLPTPHAAPSAAAALQASMPTAAAPQCSSMTPTGVAAGGGPLAGVDVELDQPWVAKRALEHHRAIRGRMWDRNVSFNGTPLRTAAEQAGLRTRAQYLAAVQWDRDLDFIAVQRVAEQLPRGYSHTRTNGTSYLTATRGAKTPYNEVLAAYRTLDESFGFWERSNPHLANILNPRRSLVGYARDARTGLMVGVMTDGAHAAGDSGLTGAHSIAVPLARDDVRVYGTASLRVGQSAPTVVAAPGVRVSCVIAAFSTTSGALRVAASGQLTGARTGDSQTQVRSGTETYAYRTSVQASGAATGLVFTDVHVGRAFRTEIDWLARQGVTTGVGSGQLREFRPDSDVRRDAMAAFLYRLAGSPSYSAPSRSPFSDVATSRPFYKEIAWLSEQGISRGWSSSDGTREFRPSDSINRDAMAAFLYRFAGSPAHTPSPTASFADVPTGRAFHREIDWMATTGISRGWQVGARSEFRPLQQIKRDAMAAFMHRFDAVS